MRRSKQTNKDQHEDGVAATLRRLGEEHVRTLAADGYDAERLVREKLGDKERDLLQALPPEDRAKTAYELFRRIAQGRITIGEASFWLSMQVRKARHKLERAANEAQDARSRGGKASTAARRRSWQPWEQWMHPHPHREFPKFQGSIIRVIQGRARGTPDEKLELKCGVPKGLPVILGKNGQSPSERSIRRHLFGAK
jgi:hypothetical protein